MIFWKIKEINGRVILNDLFSNLGTLIIDNESAGTTKLKNIANEVFNNIYHLENSYPTFNNWYFNKVVPGLIDGTRSFIIEFRDEKFAGIAILKDTAEEKKICTISINNEYKSKGIGFRLFEKSMRLLDANRPLLTVSEDRLPEFEKIFHHFDYEYVAEYHGLYLPRKRELSFNGFLH